MKLVKRIAIILGFLGLAYGMLIGIGGGIYWHNLSNVEKCIMLTKIQIMHESTLSAQFYEDEEFITRSCEALNPSSVIKPALFKGSKLP